MTTHQNLIQDYYHHSKNILVQFLNPHLQKEINRKRIEKASLSYQRRLNKFAEEIAEVNHKTEELLTKIQQQRYKRYLRF